MQLKEAEERESNQKKLYDKMFQAIEDSNFGGGLSSRGRSSDLSSQHSTLGGKELDFLHKQVQEQLNDKIDELEAQLVAKTNEVATLVKIETELKAKHAKELEPLLETKKEKDL